MSCSDNKGKEQTGRTHALAGSETDSPFGGADREEEEIREESESRERGAVSACYLEESEIEDRKENVEKTRVIKPGMERRVRVCLLDSDTERDPVSFMFRQPQQSSFQSQVSIPPSPAAVSMQMYDMESLAFKHKNQC